ncbi:TIGR03086 family metal-binding protein [Geodermatophilus marinus]|uniref:TIGR03086 family metal-binding protein n=1 Tax=Geodermatophilus sp. LHW52908 TaxID=2303986 RepID=UPI000E3E8CD9|nr:TIGR03086 family metal-binding protein [Geodermatophilus sp. LHW52908]RFU21994.1 TIGR03086 family protein [Geodermatophilus sp. LHW52908]
MSTVLPLSWASPVEERAPTGWVRYRGSLAGADRPLHLHLGLDGAGPPFTAVPLQRADDGSWVGEVPDTGGHVLLDGAVATADGEWDNNGGADHRLWIGLDPVDSHVHVRTPGLDEMGFESLRVALASGGMTHGLVSWQDNAFVDGVAAGVPWLTRLVWVSPGGPDPDEVRRRLADGAVGLKLHPSYDEYPADTPALDPFLRVAAETGVPVTVHTAPGPSDPDLIRRLAERFPTVPVVLYHTFLGLPEGRRRAARHARELPNLHLETSWCRSEEVRRLIDEVGPDRVLFGSDAAVDGPAHFVRTPPNIELVENYNTSLLRLARLLEPDVLRAFLENNTRRLFGLPAAVPEPAAVGEPVVVAEPAGAAEPVPAGPGRARVALAARSPDAATLFADALAQAERVVADVTADHLPLPTPCADWDVRALLGHLLAAVRRAERVARGRPASSVPAVAVVDPRGRWASTFAASARRAREAWAADGAPVDVPAPWGAVPAPAGLSGFVLEVVAHTHDLAVATSSGRPLDEGLATAALGFAERLVPAELRGESAAFGEPVPVPADAGPYDRLAAFLGRVPS